jgi:hypothetical protein
MTIDGWSKQDGCILGLRVFSELNADFVEQFCVPSRRKTSRVRKAHGFGSLPSISIKRAVTPKKVSPLAPLGPSDTYSKSRIAEVRTLTEGESRDAERHMSSTHPFRRAYDISPPTSTCEGVPAIDRMSLFFNDKSWSILFLLSS